MVGSVWHAPAREAAFGGRRRRRFRWRCGSDSSEVDLGARGGHSTWKAEVAGALVLERTRISPPLVMLAGDGQVFVSRC